MRHLFLFLFFTLLATGASFAQDRNCATMEYLQQMLLEDPEMIQRMEAIERHTEGFIHSKEAGGRSVITIPVVFHIVYYNSTQNVSDAQIMSQLDVLNEDFRKLNADASNIPGPFQGVSADCEINFCLATQDPDGNATTGIQRRQTSVNGFSTNNAVKYFSQGGLNAWDRDRYLNIWVCRLTNGILGYAQFPGGAAATDGVVINFEAFGTIGTAKAPFNKGRTTTHEVGHWLNLRHIWGDATCGNDFVGDTPVHNAPNYGCPAYPHYSTCQDNPLEMTMNYMDYTDDACMYMFSAGQKTRMRAVLLSGGARNSLLTSPGCDPPGGGGCNTPSGLNTANITTTSANLSWGAVGNATSYNVQWKTAAGNTWTTTGNLSGTSYSLTGLTANTTYNYRVRANCSGSSSAYSATASFTTLAANCADAYENNNTRSKAKVIPVNQAFNAQIASSSDVDWYRFSNSSAQSNIKVELYNLPLDYDLRLYRNSSLLATSQNAGTDPELIILNNNPTVSSSYYAYVYGYNGAWSNTQCYTLKVSLSGSNWRDSGETEGPVEEFEIPVVFENAGFGMWPNPARDELTLEIPMTEDGKVQIAIFNASGAMVAQNSQNMTKGDNRATLSVSHLPSGLYLVQTRFGEQTHTRKLSIQR